MTVADLERVLAARERCPSPFLVLGDPTPGTSVALALALIDAGAPMLELGLPYGDPCLDGPAIQAACVRSLSGGTSTSAGLELLGRIARERPGVPLNLLVYGNLVHARGFERFCGELAARGAATLLVPDVPLEEGAELRAACRRHMLGAVQLVGPLTSPERLRSLDEAAGGFLYLAGHQGVTGTEEADGSAGDERLRRVAAAARMPVCLGFGLSRAEHLARAFAAGARIAVVGSRLAVEIEESVASSDGEDRVVDRVVGVWRELTELG